MRRDPRVLRVAKICYRLLGQPLLCCAGDALYLQPAEEGLPLYIAELLGLAEDAHGGKSAEVRCVLRCCARAIKNWLVCLSARLHYLSDEMCTQACPCRLVRFSQC
jgi:hypothetical protein